ncbi:hypothetical protein PRIPAC_85088 [Pristionchus pacificus]|uniref:Uncharacterized protein n=1 Tax=Pristionchus pacificus TaxID=54126 RepID=A0A2A6CIQ2_PRIPA|nr:hypothetical protein PRIPAC_85088 [Pristionchus pacificus]|eukprot:PDM77986.1 hypothetical protein PRIPAC_35175 [Pristionchus pacificus]
MFLRLKSSRLAPGNITDQFIDIDRPWLLILTYTYTAFILTAATTSFGYFLVFIIPSLEDNKWLTFLRLGTTAISLSFPLIDVSQEWTKEESSTHCFDNVCRWFLSRKDACLCILLFLWSLSVSITLISANIYQFLELPHRYQLWRESQNKEEDKRPSESELAYQRQLKIERERAAEIIQQRLERKASSAREGETIPLTTPSIELSNLHPQSRYESISSRIYRSLFSPQSTRINRNGSRNRGSSLAVPSRGRGRRVSEGSFPSSNGQQTRNMGRRTTQGAL